jgi:hypothetical protein
MKCHTRDGERWAMALDFRLKSGVKLFFAPLREKTKSLTLEAQRR